MQIDDLRDYLDILEEYREVQRIDAEVDWNLEMGAITRRVYDLGGAILERQGVSEGFSRSWRPVGNQQTSRPLPFCAHRARHAHVANFIRQRYHVVLFDP